MKQQPSRAVYTLGTTLPDDTTLNAIFDRSTDKGSLVVFDHDGNFQIFDHFQDRKTGIVYNPLIDDEVRSGVITLPSNVGEILPLGEIRASVKSHIYKYLDLDPIFLEVVTDYVLMTYFYDRFEKIGYLRFFGPMDAGKSQGLKVLRGICRNSINLGAAVTFANVFRKIEKYGFNTLFMDEANFTNTSRTNSLVQILNEGYCQDGVVTRCDPSDYNSRTYRVFGPKVMANHTTFEDRALESRMFTIRMRNTKRLDIPNNLINLSIGPEATSIRNNLLRARIELNSILSTEMSYPALDQFETRSREIILPLLWAQNQTSVPEYLVEFLRQSENDQRQLHMFDPEVAVASAILDMKERQGEVIMLSDLTVTLEDRLGYPIHSRTVANQLRQLGATSKHINTGTQVFLQGVDVEDLRGRYRL